MKGSQSATTPNIRAVVRPIVLAGRLPYRMRITPRMTGIWKSEEAMIVTSHQVRRPQRPFGERAERAERRDGRISGILAVLLCDEPGLGG